MHLVGDGVARNFEGATVGGGLLVGNSDGWLVVVGALVISVEGGAVTVGASVIVMVGSEEGNPLGGEDGSMEGGELFDGAAVTVGAEDGNCVRVVGRDELVGTLDGKSEFGAAVLVGCTVGKRDLVGF